MFIIDNFLEEDVRINLLESFYKDPSQCVYSWQYFNTNFINNNVKNIFVNQALNFVGQASKFFDLKNLVGIESWGNPNVIPNSKLKVKNEFNDKEVTSWHYDLDENLLKSEGIEKFPICSLVYYLEIKDLVDGNFLTKTEQIKPITNRLIIFGPKILHAVETFSGTRIPLLMSLWDYDITKSKICDHIILN